MSPRFDRRTVLSLLATGTTATVAGCQSVLEGDAGADSEISLRSRSPVGSPFPVELPAGATDSTVTVEVAAVDSRGERFERTVESTGGGDTTRFPWSRFRSADPESFAERSKRSTPTDVTDGVGGDGPVRMVPFHLGPVGDPSPGHFVADASLSEAAYEYDVTVSIRDDDGVLTSATGTRYSAATDVVERGSLPNDLAGTLYAQEGGGPFPCVVLLHGSGGYDLVPQSRMLAAHGYAVLMLKYFGEPGLPNSLDDIPLEYFERAVTWLTDREWIDGESVGLVGYSRGVEAALLTAAGLDRPATVVGFAGSGITFFGLPESTADDESDTFIPEPAGWESAWTRDGDPVTSADAVQEAARKAGAFRDPALREAGIPVEDVDGPVLLLSSRDDDVWASPTYSEYANWRLADNDHPHPHEHVAYRDAGHVFTVPYLPYDGGGAGSRFGGSPDGNARAAADAWVRTLDYLDAGLRPGKATR